MRLIIQRLWAELSLGAGYFLFSVLLFLVGASLDMSLEEIQTF